MALTPHSDDEWLAVQRLLNDMRKPRVKAPFDPASGSGAADPLMLELIGLAATKSLLCPEARLLLEMAVDAQLGKPIDVTRLLPNDRDQRPGHRCDCGQEYELDHSEFGLPLGHDRSCLKCKKTWRANCSAA